MCLRVKVDFPANFTEENSESELRHRKSGAIVATPLRSLASRNGVQHQQTSAVFTRFSPWRDKTLG
jgi:hypothetical protein